MPIYEYLCQNCGHAFEEMQNMNEDVLVKCPNCGKNTLKRLIGAGSGIIFKGSGFYINDYKKKDTTEPKSMQTKQDNKETKEKKETKDTKESKETKENRTKEIKKDRKSDKGDKK